MKTETLIIEVPDDDKDRQKALEAILKMLGYSYTKSKSKTASKSTLKADKQAQKAASTPNP